MKHSSLIRFAPALALAALASCGASKQASNETNGGTAVENATLARLSLTSDAFQDGQPIPDQFSCDGANQSPALKWDEPPAGTKSFALVIDDPDAPSGTYRHWGAYDIPASTRSIASGQRVGTEVNNDKGTPGYTGPCPPKGHGVHHYHFRLFALDVDRLALSPNPKVADVENEASKHAIARGELIGMFERR
jgi:Raf kinase inhibitor-like YbhB/YbcL family protein